jgi:hypothetical protein
VKVRKSRFNQRKAVSERIAGVTMLRIIIGAGAVICAIAICEGASASAERRSRSLAPTNVHFADAEMIVNDDELQRVLLASERRIAQRQPFEPSFDRGFSKLQNTFRF